MEPQITFNELLDNAKAAIDNVVDGTETGSVLNIYCDFLTDMMNLQPSVTVKKFNRGIRKINKHLRLYGLSFLGDNPVPEPDDEEPDDIDITPNIVTEGDDGEIITHRAPNLFEIQPHDPENTDDCPICTCELTDMVFRCSQCHHEVCAGCMRQWLSTHIQINGLAEGLEDETFQYGLHRTCPFCNVYLM